MPRNSALWILEEVLERKQPFDDSFARDHNIPKLEPRDRAFARLLVTTTLRRLGQIDDIILDCLEKPLPEKAHRARNILRLGVCQIEFLDTPAYAAVDTAVRMANKPQTGRYKGLINGVLRRIDRSRGKNSADQDAAKLNTPDWLWESWSSAYGKDVCRQIAETHLEEPPLDITLGDVTADEFDSWQLRLKAERMPNDSLRLSHAGAVPALPGYGNGGWWVQDAAAAVPATLMGDVRSKTVLDLCAAPGGKAAQLAAAGAQVTALDRSGKRMSMMSENMQRLHLSVKTVVADAEQWRPSSPADAVLLDAPCSATGTIRRHPDIAWLKSAKDVQRAAEVQLRLLKAATHMVRPGGVLLYAVCSLEPVEGEAVIEKFLSSGAPFKRKAIMPAECPYLAEQITPAGDLRTLPCVWRDKGGMDGFFMSRLTRE